MRKYELMYIIRPNVEEAAAKELVERFNTILTDNGAEVEKTEERGKRRLAYEIDDLKEGYYVLLKANAPTEAIDEFTRLVRINDNVLRHIVVRDDE